MDTTTFNTAIRVLCKLHRGSVSSTHRTIDHNRAVGGAPDSQHLTWRAADIVLDDWALKNELIMTARALGFWVLDETQRLNHVHIDDRYDAQL